MTLIQRDAARAAITLLALRKQIAPNAEPLTLINQKLKVLTNDRLDIKTRIETKRAAA